MRDVHGRGGGLTARVRLGRRDRRAWLAVATVVAAVVVIVVVGVASWSGPGGSSRSSFASTASGASLPPETPPVSAAVVGAPDDAGTFPGGGLWAISGATLLISTDAGTSWRGNPVPLAAGSVPTAFVLDSTHAWSITPGPGTTEFTGSPTDVLRLVVHRTADGGSTWDESAVPGSFAGTGQWLVFVDAQHGFLLCAAKRGSAGTSGVLRTDDGGTSWAVAGTSPWLGSMFSASDGATLWAGANQEAGPVAHPLLAASRDGGRTWGDARLPGLEGKTGGGDRWLVGPPLFTDADHGLVTFASSNDNGDPTTRIYRTDDGGRSWTLAAEALVEASAGPAVLADGHWLLPIDNPLGLLATADGGATWQRLAAISQSSTAQIVWVGALDASHAAALVTTDNAGSAALYLSDDEGASWRPADSR